MDAPLISAATPASVTLAPEAAPGSAPPAMRGAEFANLLGHLMNPGERQDLAAAGLQTLPIGPQIAVITAAEPMPDAASLAAFARGQGLDENTVKALFGGPSADAQPTFGSALGATLPAAGQTPLTLTAPPVKEEGADATAMVSAALALGGLRLVTTPPQPLGQAPALVGDAPVPQKASASDELALQHSLALGGLRLVTTLPQPLEQAAAMLGDAPVPQKAPASDELALQQSLVLASGGALPALVGRGMVQAAGGVAVTGKPALSVAQVASASAPATAAAPSAAAAPATAAAVVAAASSVPLTAVEGARVSQVSWQVPSVAAPQPVVPVHELQPQGAAAAATAALSDVAPEALPEVMRLRLAPTEFITRRLAAMAGTGEQATWGSVAGESVAAVGLLRLDMRGLNLVGPSSPLAVPATQAVDALDPQADAQPALGAAHPSHEPGRPQALSPAASAPAPWVSTAAQRTEQYEQLAQRLGEALGQRLQSQLERGEWKVQMRLDPAHLGRIDLSLDMSAGGLDAVFRSDNQATRDLIAQGLPRLRESLSQSGTAVANVWVQGDSNRQTGGNPTPGRTPDPHDETASGRDAGSDEPLAAPAVARPRQGTSAWDVLA